MYPSLTTVTNREKDVLRLISLEWTAKEIASSLHLSVHTVDSHRKNLKSKLNVKNTAGMIRRGFELGLLQMPGTLYSNT